MVDIMVDIMVGTSEVVEGGKKARSA